jgi:two-component sensor histidine kinase
MANVHLCAERRGAGPSTPPSHGSAPNGGVLSKSKIEEATGLSRTIAQSNVVSPIVMRELQHRVANTLTILNSSLRLELATFKVPGLEEALRRHEKHVVAVAELHRFFGRCPEAFEISAESYFQPLCALLSKSILAPMGLHCEVSIDKGPMRAEKCEFLGLVITELVLNAAKHAFPGNISGCVRIEIVERDERWYCTVSDDGIGIWKISLGNGSKITDGLVDALGGQLTIRTGPNGTAVSITFISQRAQPWI